MYSPGLAARRAAQEAQWQEQQHESATDAGSGLWHAGFDALTSRVSRGLFGGESLSDNGVHKVVKVELQQLSSADAAGLIEALRRKYSVPPSASRPVAVGVSLHVGTDEVKVNHVVCGAWGWHKDHERSARAPMKKGDVLLKVNGFPVTSLHDCSRLLHDGPIGTFVDVFFSTVNILGVSVQGQARLLRQDRRILDELVAVEEALDDWRDAARALGGTGGCVAATKLDTLGKHVAILGSATAELEAELSAANRSLSAHVTALEEQLLSLAKGYVVRVPDSTSKMTGDSEGGPNEALMVGAEVARVRGEDNLRLEIARLQRELGGKEAVEAALAECQTEVARLRRKELEEAREDVASRGYILGTDGPNMRASSLEREVVALKALNKTLSRELEGAREQAAGQMRCVMDEAQKQREEDETRLRTLEERAFVAEAALSKAKVELEMVRRHAAAAAAARDDALQVRRDGQLKQHTTFETAHKELLEELAACQQAEMSRTAECGGLKKRMEQMLLEQKAAAALSKQLDEALTAKSNLTQELDSLRARCDGLEKKAEETEWKLKSAVVNMEAAEAKNQHLDSELENAQRQDMQNRSNFDRQVSALQEQLRGAQNKVTKLQEEVGHTAFLKEQAAKAAAAEQLAIEAQQRLEQRVQALQREIEVVSETTAAAVTEQDTKISQLHSQVAEAARAREVAEDSAKALEGRLELDLTELAKLKAKTAELQAANLELKADLIKAETACRQAEELNKQLELSAHGSKQRETALRDKCDGLEVERQEREEELRCIKQLHSERCCEVEDLLSAAKRSAHAMEKQSADRSQEQERLTAAEGAYEDLRNELAQAMLACDAAETSASHYRLQMAEWQGRLEEMEALLQEERLAGTTARASAESALEELAKEVQSHQAVKTELQKALEDLDAWEEERTKLIQMHNTSQSTLEAERQALLDTEVALRAELHRIQHEHVRQRQEDLAQLQQLHEWQSNDSKLREHSCMLESRVSELQESLQKAEAELGRQAQALEAVVAESAAGHQASEMALDDLHNQLEVLRREQDAREAAHTARLRKLAAEHTQELAGQLRESEAVAAAQVHAAELALAATHSDLIGKLKDKHAQEIDDAASVCREQLKKVQDACRDRVDQVEAQGKAEADERARAARAEREEMDKVHAAQVRALEESLALQASQHKEETQKQLHEAVSALSEEKREALREQEDKYAERVAVLNEQLMALKQARQEDLEESAALRRRHQDEIARLQEQQTIAASAGGETRRRLETQLQQAHAREMERVQERLQAALDSACQDRDDAHRKRQELEGKVADMAHHSALMQTAREEQEERLRAMQAECESLKGKVKDLLRQMDHIRQSEREAREAVRAADLEAQGHRLNAASKDSVVEQLTEALEEARGDKHRANQEAQIEALRSELAHKTLALASLEGKQKAASAEAARLRALETTANKEAAKMRDAHHAESCKAASLQGRIEALEQDLVHERRRLAAADDEVERLKSESRRHAVKLLDLERRLAKQSAITTADITQVESTQAGESASSAFGLGGFLTSRDGAGATIGHLFSARDRPDELMSSPSCTRTSSVAADAQAARQGQTGILEGLGGWSLFRHTGKGASDVSA